MSKAGYNYVRKRWRENGILYEVSGKTEEEAIAKMLRKKADLAAGRINTNMTVNAWSNVWLETYVQPRGLTPKSYELYTCKLDNIILPAIGKYKLKDVNPTQLQRLLNTRAGRSASDTGKLRMVIKAMFRQAYLDRLLPYDPAEGLQMPRTTKGQHRSLTDEERAALLSVCAMEKLGGQRNNSSLWLQCILYCGLRPGETAALQWRNVDLNAGLLNIDSAKESGSKTIKSPKTASGYRSVPIPDIYLTLLKEAHKLRRPAPGDFVFPQRDGRTPQTDTSMRAMWRTVKKYMDLELGAKVERIKPEGKRKHIEVIVEHALSDDIDLYCLRHTYCTDLQAAGVPINIAKELMGHSDISVTANIYTHSTSTGIESARSLINAHAVKSI